MSWLNATMNKQKRELSHLKDFHVHQSQGVEPLAHVDKDDFVWHNRHHVSWDVGLPMTSTLNEPGASTKFTDSPLPDDGEVWETINSLKVARGIGEFWECIPNALRSRGTTFLIFDLEVVVT